MFIPDLFILPVRSMLPCWQEVLIYNDIYSYFLQREEGDPEVIIFFEVRLKESGPSNCPKIHTSNLTWDNNRCNLQSIH